ncbi:PTS sugar transporter subunit IIA [Sodalis ligni]|uniref:PTS sugar transporter subunit IIA n=1 Tax=Sodalis ligni TaxID=2697027 RepID=UPI00193EE343|nr:PTS sugar transporter subunit IIA [Sodalis ligni]QWA10010.1 PTS sugar transporter subunit IIA [Sodalis ligni]
MTTILNENNIVLNASFSRKEDAIRAAGKLLLDGGYVTEKYIDYMLKREEVVSTYLGNNLALPHGIDGSENEIIRSGIAVIQVPNGVSFGKDNQDDIAHIVIGIAGKDGSHMDILNQIAIACMEEENVQQMRHATNKADILNLLGL